VHYDSADQPEDKRALMKSDKLWYEGEKDWGALNDGDEEEDAFV